MANSATPKESDQPERPSFIQWIRKQSGVNLMIWTGANRWPPKRRRPMTFFFLVGRILLDAVQWNAARSSDQINHELSFLVLMCSFRRENGSPINLGKARAKRGKGAIEEITKRCEIIRWWCWGFYSLLAS